MHLNAFVHGQGRHVHLHEHVGCSPDLQAHPPRQPGNTPPLIGRGPTLPDLSLLKPSALQQVAAAAPVLLVADPGTKPETGLVLSVAPLMGALPQVDAKHARWLHVQVGTGAASRLPARRMPPPPAAIMRCLPALRRHILLAASLPVCATAGSLAPPRLPAGRCGPPCGACSRCCRGRTPATPCSTCSATWSGAPARRTAAQLHLGKVAWPGHTSAIRRPPHAPAML